MSESNIFEFLLKDDKDFLKGEDYPKLQPKLMGLVSKTITDTIYNLNKIKSTSSTQKRLELLKFVQCLVCRNQRHDSITTDNNQEYIHAIAVANYEEKDSEFANFVRTIETELTPFTLHNRMIDFNARKAERSSKDQTLLSKIQKYDAEVLEREGFTSDSHKSYRDPSRSTELINDLLINSSIVTKCDENEKNFDNIDETVGFRKKQIKFAHALLNLDKLHEVASIIHKLSHYSHLQEFEIKFLMNLSTNHKITKTPDLQQLIIDKFPSVYETLVVQMCTLILTLENDEEIANYFETVVLDEKFITLKEICNTDRLLLTKLKDLCYYLYSYSDCNENILKMCEFLMN